MTSLREILSCIHSTMQNVTDHQGYSSKPGLYAFFLPNGSSLKAFGKGSQIIYVGKAEDSLRQRDLNTHFKDNRTGYSTLRRSIGSILKKELNAIAFSRNGTLKKPNIDNYIFDTKAERKLSDWMNKNLLIGYWEYNHAIETKSLRDIEVELIIELKPTLDLDQRTRKYNIYKEQLIELRQVCKDEARQNVKIQLSYY